MPRLSLTGRYVERYLSITNRSNWRGLVQEETVRKRLKRAEQGNDYKTIFLLRRLLDDYYEFISTV